jgi:hypothetical protein
VLGIKISDIFNALQSTLGTYYVNDFNVFGRTWQVNIQADTPFRKRADDVDRIYVRNAQGAEVPIRALGVAKLVQGPQTVVRYNGYRAAVVNGAAKPGFSSGQALAALESVSAATLPLGYSFEWTGTAFQEKAATSARIIDPCTCSGRAPSFPASLPRMRVTMSAGSTCPGAYRVPAVGTSLRQIAVSTEFYRCNGQDGRRPSLHAHDCGGLQPK